MQGKDTFAIALRPATRRICGEMAGMITMALLLVIGNGQAQSIRKRKEIPMVFETLNVKREGAALFIQIAAPPMNLLGPGLVRDLVTLIQHAQADDTLRVLVFKSADPDYFVSHVDVTKIREYREEAARLSGPRRRRMRPTLKRPRSFGLSVA